MSTRTRNGVRTLIMFGVCGLFMTAPLSAQDTKHDKEKPAHPVCPPGKKPPCPPGHGEGTPPGRASLVAPANLGSVVVAPDMQLTAHYVELVTLLRASALPTANPLPSVAQRALVDIVDRAIQANGSALVQGLTARGNDEALAESIALANALRDLTLREGQLTVAVEAFNALVDASNEAFLQDPSAEFLAVRAFLAALIEQVDPLHDAR